MDGVRPARIADQVIDDLRKRECNGLVELPKREMFAWATRCASCKAHSPLRSRTRPHDGRSGLLCKAADTETGERGVIEGEHAPYYGATRSCGRWREFGDGISVTAEALA
jgi:hypothetical protein